MLKKKTTKKDCCCRPGDLVEKNKSEADYLQAEGMGTIRRWLQLADHLLDSQDDELAAAE
ncbi:MAG TPA: hypothetical protein VKZ53_19755 [Candidatus Angelobacter sp.]|nr:hypothetical protein [Candidatus Angelobacter sp.]